MKKYIIHSVLFLVILLVSLGGMVAFMPMEKSNYLYMLNIKDSLLRETPSPRLVLISGSSFAFGVDSKMLQDSLEINVVNMGLHAGLGLKYILDDAMRYLHKGDVVVISLEYQHLVNQMYGDDVTLGPAMYYTSYRNLNLLNFTQAKYAIMGTPTAIRMNWNSRKARNMTIYSVLACNQWGDEEGHRKDTVHHQLPMIKAKKEVLNEEFCRCFFERLDKIQSKGCKLIITPAPMWKDAFNPELAKDIYTLFATTKYRLNTSFQNHLFSADKMYDTQYHLNQEGVLLFTETLIKELRNEIIEEK